MRELGHGLGLAAEPLAEGLFPSEIRVKCLDGDLPVEHAVVREVHRGHAALAEEVTQLIAATGERPPRVLALCAVLAHVPCPP
ncbi:hypothetical protein QFZ55_004220 [Streptomyces luteogriseus]|nr:hypothetical protein [Streptomyces luteogriseus]